MTMPTTPHQSSISPDSQGRLRCFSVGAALGTVSLIAALALVGCAASGPGDGSNAGDSIPAGSGAAAPASDIDASVQTFVSALDSLGISHSDPVRREVGISGASASFDITVDGFDAGINIFPDADTLKVWGTLSDRFGGIYVASGNAVLSLNSHEGVADSAEIAPKIAEKVGGEAHGV